MTVSADDFKEKCQVSGKNTQCICLSLFFQMYELLLPFPAHLLAPAVDRVLPELLHMRVK